MQEKVPSQKKSQKKEVKRCGKSGIVYIKVQLREFVVSKIYVKIFLLYIKARKGYTRAYQQPSTLGFIAEKLSCLGTVSIVPCS